MDDPGDPDQCLFMCFILLNVFEVVKGSIDDKDKRLMRTRELMIVRDSI